MNPTVAHSNYYIGFIELCVALRYGLLLPIFSCLSAGHMRKSAEADEPIEMPFGCGHGWAQGTNHVLHGGPDLPREGALLQGTFPNMPSGRMTQRDSHVAACGDVAISPPLPWQLVIAAV